MRLVRNITPDGKCKYALIRLDKLRLKDHSVFAADEVCRAFDILEEHGVLEYAGLNDPEEAFVIKLKDENAEAALRAYAAEIFYKDPELSDDVFQLATRAARRKDKHAPD